MATPIRITPNAKKEENVIPIAVSPLITLFSLIKVMMKEANIPKITAPIKKLIPKIKDIATPGNTACEIASPISDIERKIIKQPIAPETIPITTAVTKAFCKNDRSLNR